MRAHLTPRLVTSLAALGALLSLNTPAQAQVFESVGNRGLGMGGAFVGASSDYTATYWNPGGLGAAGLAGATIGWVRFQTGNPAAAPTAGPTRRESTFYSFGSGPLALSYGRIQSTTLVTDNGSLFSETFKISQFGITAMQSLTEHIVLGATAKLMRGAVSSTGVTASDVTGALDAGAGLKPKPAMKFDYDVGVMAQGKYARIGLTLKNLQAPTFPNVAGTSITLKRQARMGAALTPNDGLTFAVDVDLDTVALRDGLRQMIAVGGEQRIGRHVYVRGGLRWSFKGESRRVGTIGTSVEVKRGSWIDGQYTLGQETGDRGFGVTLRIGG